MPYTDEDVGKRPRILRMLLGGPVKSGKTCAAVMTSPQPVFVFNTDGKGALDPVQALGGKFTAGDASSLTAFENEMRWFRAHQNKFQTVVFDNITRFAKLVEKDFKKQYKDGRQMWPAYSAALMNVFQELIDLPHHLVVIGHIVPGENGVPGGFDHMLGLSGSAKTEIGAIIQDWVWLQVELDPTQPDGVRRDFLLAPQGNWTKAVRSIQHTKKMKANVTRFIKLMSPDAKVKKIEATPVVEPEPEPEAPQEVEEEDDLPPEPAPPAVTTKPQQNGASKKEYRPAPRPPVRPSVKP